MRLPLRRSGFPESRPRRRPVRHRLAIEALEDRRLLSGTAAISGTVLEDLTGNGISSDDLPVAGRAVSLFLVDDSGSVQLVEQTTTRNNGGYRFNTLDAGTYLVQQDLPLGWVQSTPEATPEDEVLTPDTCGTTPSERNDTLATAVATGLSSAAPGTYIACGTIGDNPRVDDVLDVDMFQVHVNAGDRLHVDIDAVAVGSQLNATLRIFDAAGIQVAGNDDNIGDNEDPQIEFVARTTGTYYVGVSGFANVFYNPAIEESGTLAFNTGMYTLQIEAGPRPGADPITVTLGDNEHRTGVDLASSQLGSIHGQIFEDLDGDGQQDPGEPGLDGEFVLLTHQGVNFSFTFTRSIDLDQNGTIDPASEAGVYSFADLRPGIYFTRTLIAFGLGPAGVIQTSPSLEGTTLSCVGEVPSGPGSDPGIPGLVPDLTVDLATGLCDRFITGNVLHFGQSTPNIGLGPMELRAGEDLGNGTQIVLQRIYQDTALSSFIDLDAGTFSFHPEHNHIHFDDYAEFSVRQALPDDADADDLPEVGDVVAGGDKRSFCLVDVAPYDLSLPNADPDGSEFGCGGVQRISVGWADIYDPLLAGQQIDISGLAPGQYWLEAVLDPLNHLIESNETNNIGRALITIGLGGPDSPAGGHGVQLVSGQVTGDTDFANFRLINISGQVFDDRNGNGRLDRNEHGLDGWTIFIDTNGDGVLNNPEGDNIPSALASEPWATTDNQGNYAFAEVGPGTHQLLLVAQAGWTLTTPIPDPIEAHSGQDVPGVNFGIHQVGGESSAFQIGWPIHRRERLAVADSSSGWKSIVDSAFMALGKQNAHDRGDLAARLRRETALAVNSDNGGIHEFLRADRLAARNAATSMSSLSWIARSSAGREGSPDDLWAIFEWPG